MSRTNTCASEEALDREVCTVLGVLDRVSGKWSLGVLGETRHGPVRFAELERSLNGISRRMLTLTLRELEEKGLLIRTVYPTVPPKVEYTATEPARELYTLLRGLTAWAERHPATATRGADTPRETATGPAEPDRPWEAAAPARPRPGGATGTR